MNTYLLKLDSANVQQNGHGLHFCGAKSIFAPQILRSKFAFCSASRYFCPKNFPQNMATFIHQRPDWPNFRWDSEVLLPQLAQARNLQGRLFGQMSGLGFELNQEAFLETMSLDVLKSSEIEGEFLAPEKVRSSLARQLRMETGGIVPSDRSVDGIVDMVLDATQNFEKQLTSERLFDWHAALFPLGKNSMFKITTGNWRTDEHGPMRVVSGAMGMERVHFQAPDATNVASEMALFIAWFNAEQNDDAVLKAGVAHLWFVTVHPFDDGNGRIGRAIMDLQLSKSDKNPKRFYSISAQILRKRKEYYGALEKAQRGDMDITDWLAWYLDCLEKAVEAAQFTLEKVLTKARFWEKHAKTPLNERQVFMLNKFLGDFDGKLNSSKYAKMAKCSQDTAARDLQDLAKKMVLEKDPIMGRNTNYLLARTNS